jgi:hypothetical protein
MSSGVSISFQLFVAGPVFCKKFESRFGFRGSESRIFHNHVKFSLLIFNSFKLFDKACVLLMRKKTENVKAYVSLPHIKVKAKKLRADTERLTGLASALVRNPL